MRITIFYIIVFCIAISGIAKGQETPEKHENADSLYASFVYYNNTHNYDSSMHYGDKFINHRVKYGTISQAIAAYDHKIKSLIRFNKLNKAFKITLTIYDNYCANNIDRTKCESCYLIYNHLAEFMITLRDYRQGINYIDNGCNSEGNERNFYIKAKLYSLLEKPDSALIQTLKSIRIARPQKNPEKLVATYNQHGIIARKIKRYDDAIIAFSTAISLVDSLGLDKQKFGYLTGNLGSCYYLKGDLNSAYNFLQIDADKSKMHDVGSYLSAEISLTEIDIKKKNYKKALLRLDTLQDIYETKNEYDPIFTTSQELQILELYMNVFQMLGDKTNYEYHLKKWVSLMKNDSQSRIETNQILLEEYAANTLKQATLQVETEKELLNQKLIIKEQEERQSKLQKWILAGGAILIILIILFFLSRYRKRALLKETQLKLANKEQEFLKLKIQEENRNVQALSHELLAKQDFSTKLIQQLEEFDSISKQELRNIELYIQNELDIKSTRAHLQNQMGELSSNFYSELKIKHPNLTELELKLAGMVVMKMSNKEIAISKNTTLESSKKAKNRLKKKLHISASDKLSVYLDKFL